VIGYYIHHSGNGHRARALSICARINPPVTALTSLPVPEPHGFDHVIQLPRDDAQESAHDPTANGTLHWVPLHDSGLRERMRRIAEWISAAHPAAMVVDVSVEVATLARILGVPVVVMAMPGQRTDAPHQLVYQLAHHIVAAWPGELYEPAWLRPHRHKTSYVGGITRFDGRARGGTAARDAPRVLIFGGGAHVTIAGVHRCAEQHPQFQWTGVGVTGASWAEDPWPELIAADIVITHAGEGSVADIAAAERPAIIIPQPRPFGEQHATARVLGYSGLATIRPHWPRPGQWAELLEMVGRSDGRRWCKWRTAQAADRAAAAIERVAANTTLGKTR
jgi:hypothetical protein